MSTIDLDRILPKIPRLAERQAVQAAIAASMDIYDRRDGVLDPLHAKRDAVRREYDAKCAELRTAMFAVVDAEITTAEAPFNAELEALPGYTNASDYQMWEDWLGCSCCDITGLPLRDDDEVIAWGEGEALVDAITAALEKA